jgi:hypothetical protein
MTVERRYCARCPVNFPVQIRYRKRRFLGGKARDLSADGLYLEVRNLTLPSGTLVELELDLQGKQWLVAAVVVHHHGNGVGVMFRDHQPELFREATQPLSPATTDGWRPADSVVSIRIS